MSLPVVSCLPLRCLNTTTYRQVVNRLWRNSGGIFRSLPRLAAGFISWRVKKPRPRGCAVRGRLERRATQERRYL